MAIIDLDKNEIISKLKTNNKSLAKINNKPLQIKRGNKANLPQLADGELAFVKDEEKLYIGKDGIGNVPIPSEKENKEINSKLLDISKEITEARTDYFGKEHATLKAKEDKEFEYVHIDNTKGLFVEQSTSTGHMKIENSIEGRARDTVIKGRTLHNLCLGNFPHTISSSLTRFKLVYPYDLSKINTILIDVSNLSDGAYFTFAPNTNNGSGLNPATITKNGLTVVKTNPVQVGDSPITDSLSIWNIQGQETGKDIVINSIIFLEGDWTNKIDQIPTTYFEGIKSLGEEENKIRILTCGKNLLKPLDESMFDFSPIQLDNYSFVAGGRQAIKCNIEVETNTDYVFSCKAKPLVGSSEMLVRWFENGTLKGTMVNNKMNINSQSCNIQLAFYVGAPFDISQVQYSELMIQKCKDTNDLNFQVYKEDKRDILFPVQFGCKSLPSGVADESYDNGDYLQRIEKYTVTGNDSFRLGKELTNTISFNTTKTDAKPNWHNWGGVISDKFKGGDTYSFDDEAVAIDGNKSLFFRILKSKLETPDIAGFKEWLQANPVTVYYELAEPILHKAQTLQNNNPTTFKDITHVSCLNKIAPSSMSGKFPVDMSGTISRLNRENKELEKENVELNKTIENQAIYFNEQTIDLATVDFETDFRLMEIEFALDIPINLNLKGMKNMAARTPYDMAKIVILGGNYDRADMEYKLSVYVKRGRMTQEEHDELIALMDAKEIVQK